MSLTNTFVKNIKHSIGSAVGKYRDGGGMYLLVNASGKYWRMDYRFADKRKTLSLGVYPSISLANQRLFFLDDALHLSFLRHVSSLPALIA